MADTIERLRRELQHAADALPEDSPRRASILALLEETEQQ